MRLESLEARAWCSHICVTSLRVSQEACLHYLCIYLFIFSSLKLMLLCFIDIFKCSYYQEEAGPISDTSKKRIIIIINTKKNQDQLWWEVKRSIISGGRGSRCGKFNVNWKLQRSKSKACCQIRYLRFHLSFTYKYTQLNILSGVVLQSIIFIDKVLSGRLLGRVGRRTQKGQVAVYFVKPGRRNNTSKVSLMSNHGDNPNTS